MNKNVGSSQLIQKMNRLNVLNYIRRNPEAARPQIAAPTLSEAGSVKSVPIVYTR